MADPQQPVSGPTEPDVLVPVGASAPGSIPEEGVAVVDPPARRSRRVPVDLNHPFGWGFAATAGALVAIALGSAITSLSTVLVSVGAALFIALALEPVVKFLERHRMSRAVSIGVVFAGFALLFGVVVAVVVPTAIQQVTQFAAAVPGYITEIQNSAWFQSMVAASGASDLYESVLTQVRTWLSDPANLMTIAGGALAVGSGLVSAISGTLIVLVLTLYFLASMKAMQNALVRLAPARSRSQLSAITLQISDSVGGYVSGMAILAACNATFAFILLTILGVPFAALLAFLALLITMIPMVGSVLFWLLATVVTLFTSGWSALIFAGIYFAYMQVEAYIMTPRVMTKAVDVPGSLVLIGAMVGGTLLGLLGALVAVPVTASLLMIVKTVFIPRQDAKVLPD